MRQNESLAALAMRRSRKSAGEKFLTGCITSLVSLPLYASLHAWLLMLGFGAVHHAIHEAVPAIGFWSSSGIALGLYALISMAERARGATAEAIAKD